MPSSTARVLADQASHHSGYVSGIKEGGADGGADCNGAHSRSATPMLWDKLSGLSGVDGQDKGNSSSMSASSVTSSSSTMLAGFLQAEPFAMSDNITSRRGSRGCHNN
jgi:hypothetical protein